MPSSNKKYSIDEIAVIIDNFQKNGIQYEYYFDIPSFMYLLGGIVGVGVIVTAVYALIRNTNSA